MQFNRYFKDGLNLRHKHGPIWHLPKRVLNPCLNLNPNSSLKFQMSIELHPWLQHLHPFVADQDVLVVSSQLVGHPQESLSVRTWVGIQCYYNERGAYRVLHQHCCK